MGNININNAIQNVASKARHLYPPVENKDEDKFHSETYKQANLPTLNSSSDTEENLSSLTQQWANEIQADQMPNDENYTQIVVIGDFIYIIHNSGGMASAPEFIRTVRVNPEAIKDNIAAIKA